MVDAILLESVSTLLLVRLVKVFLSLQHLFIRLVKVSSRWGCSPIISRGIFMFSAFLKQTLHNNKRYIFSCIAALLLACSTVPMRADVDDCTCTIDSLISDNLTICIGGTNYVVDVYGCRRVGLPPTYLPQICPTSLLQNQYTTITKVCFVGARPIPIDPRATFNAILCEWDPCKTPGIMGAIVPPVPGDRYCWTTFFPKCVGVDNLTGCIHKCGDGCCILSRRFERQLDGSCLKTRTWVCDVPNTSCISPCTVIDCPEPTCCN